MDMKIRFKDVVVHIGKDLFFFIKISYRAVCDHPFLVVFVFFSYLLHNLHPGLFSFLVNSAPVIICSMLLLGTLLSYGDPHIPEIEEEGEMEFSHNVSALQVHKTAQDFAIKEKGNSFMERQVGEEMKGDHTLGPLEYSGWDFANIFGNIWRTKGDNIVNGASSSAEKEQLEMHGDERITKEGSQCLKCAARLFTDHSMENKGVDLELSETDQDSCYYSNINSSKNRLVRHNGFSISKSDGAESSSPEASMADIIPMLEELHPLLDSDLSETVHIKIDDSDDTTEVSSEDQRSYHSSEDFEEDLNENQEDDEQEVSEENVDDGEAVIAWTAYDLNNVLDLGNSEPERNERLENMIAKQKARRNAEVENFKISPICTRRLNPSDDHNGSEGNTGLPPIPGSAPPVLCKMRIPSDDIAINHANDGDIAAMVPKHQPFMPARNFPSHRYALGEPFSGDSKEQKSVTKPLSYFAPEENITDKESFSQFQRGLSEINDYKLSSIPKFDSVSSNSDPEDHEGIIEIEEVKCEDLPISYGASQLGVVESAETNSSSSAVNNQHSYLSDVEDLETIPMNVQEPGSVYSLLGKKNIEDTDDTLLDPLLSPDEGNLHQNNLETYAKQRSFGRVSFQIDESMIEESEDDECIPSTLTGRSIDVQSSINDSEVQSSDFGMDESSVTAFSPNAEGTKNDIKHAEDTNTYAGLIDAAPEQPITNRELIEDINVNETTETLVHMHTDDDFTVFPSAFTQDDSFIGICTTHPVRDKGPFTFSEVDSENLKIDPDMNSPNTESENRAANKMEETTGVASFKSNANSIPEVKSIKDVDSPLKQANEDNAGIMNETHSNIPEAVGQSVEDMHVLKQQTEAGSNNTTNLNELSTGKIESHESVCKESSEMCSDPHQIKLQIVEDPNDVLKEIGSSLTDYAEDNAHPTLEVQSKIYDVEDTSFVLKHEVEQIIEDTNMEKMEFHEELHEMEAKSVGVTNDGVNIIKDEPTEVQLEYNMGIQSKPHEVKTYSSQDKELPLEQFSEGINEIVGKESECTSELGVSGRYFEPNMENQSDFNEEEAEQNTSTLEKHNKSEDVSFEVEVGESENQLKPSVENKSEFHEIVAGTTKELNIAIEQFDRENTMRSLEKHSKSEDVSPSVENESDLHEIAAGTTEELNMAIEKFDRQNTMHSLEKHSKSEDVSPSVENEADLHEIVAGTTKELNMAIEKFDRQYTSKYIECETSFEVDENEKQMEPNVEMHSHMPEVKVCNAEELNMAIKQLDRQNTSQYIECETSFEVDENEKQMEPIVETDSHVLEVEACNTEELNMAMKQLDRQNTSKYIECKSSFEVDGNENQMEPNVEVHEVETRNTEESNMGLKEFDSNTISVLEKFIESGTLFELDGDEDPTDPNVEMQSVMQEVEAFTGVAEFEFEDAPSDFEQTEIHVNSDLKTDSHKHDVEARSVDDISSALDQISKGTTAIPDEAIDHDISSGTSAQES